MRIKLDAKVRTKDGHGAGHVKRVIWDPKTNEVTAFVIATGGLLGHDVLIGRDVLESATYDGEEIVIDMSRDELRVLEPFAEEAYTLPPLGWVAPFPYDYPAASYLMTAEPFIMPSPRPPAGTQRERPERPAISKGMRVRDAGGETLGVVDEVRTDEVTGELRAMAGDEVHVIEETHGTSASRG
ncbi:MAG: hypothetical protein AUH85_13245 [Chloroflexi bacterium 13_1_40CM_4_68_4]|nr:MAG: hypothetical protein AUH85_13245 [Chloroflexi bacterium 13_1_40CM_4_68_4]